MMLDDFIAKLNELRLMHGDPDASDAAGIAYEVAATAYDVACAARIAAASDA